MTTPNLKQIIAATAHVTGVREEILKGAQRNHRASSARHLGFWAAIEAGHSYPKTGDAFGGRDHTTIIHGRKRVAERPEKVAGALRVLAAAERLSESGSMSAPPVPIPNVVRTELPPLPRQDAPIPGRKVCAIPPTVVIQMGDRRTEKHAAGYAAHQNRW